MSPPPSIMWSHSSQRLCLSSSGKWPISTSFLQQHCPSLPCHLIQLSVLYCPLSLWSASVCARKLLKIGAAFYRYVYIYIFFLLKNFSERDPSCWAWKNLQLVTIWKILSLLLLMQTLSSLLLLNMILWQYFGSAMYKCMFVWPGLWFLCCCIKLFSEPFLCTFKVFFGSLICSHSVLQWAAVVWWGNYASWTSASVASRFKAP